MKANIYTVNEQGLREIKKFLAERNKKGVDITHDILLSWAADAEFQLAEGNSAVVEILSTDTVSGNTEAYTISDDGLDCDEIEIEE